jgi:hypothetical protein
MAALISFSVVWWDRAVLWRNGPLPDAYESAVTGCQSLSNEPLKIYVHKLRIFLLARDDLSRPLGCLP